MSLPVPAAVVVEPWTQAQAIELCVKLHAIAPNFGAHIGLTGGALYKAGERKDCDILIYRIRQASIDFPGLWAAFGGVGVVIDHDFGFCVKAHLGAQRIDFLCPESPGNEYQKPNEP